MCDAFADAFLLLLHDGEGALDLGRVFRDERRDLLCRCFRLFGELSHLFGDNGEALARFAGACGLDGGVQGEEVRLAGNLGDHLNDFGYAFRSFVERVDSIRRTAVDGLHSFDGDVKSALAFCRRLVCFSGGGSDIVDDIDDLVHFIGHRVDRVDGAIDDVVLLLCALGDMGHSFRSALRSVGGLPRRRGQFFGGYGKLISSLEGALYEVVQVLGHLGKALMQPTNFILTVRVTEFMRQIALCHLFGDLAELRDRRRNRARDVEDDGDEHGDREDDDDGDDRAHLHDRGENFRLWHFEHEHPACIADRGGGKEHRRTILAPGGDGWFAFEEGLDCVGVFLLVVSSIVFDLCEMKLPSSLRRKAPPVSPTLMAETKSFTASRERSKPATPAT